MKAVLREEVNLYSRTNPTIYSVRVTVKENEFLKTFANKDEALEAIDLLQASKDEFFNPAGWTKIQYPNGCPCCGQLYHAGPYCPDTYR